MTDDDGIGSMAEAIAEEADSDSASAATSSEKWPGALATLASARIAIISAESGDAVAMAAKKALYAAIAVVALLGFWLVALVGVIGLIPQISGLTWYQVAFIIAGLHLAVAIVAALLLVKKSAPVFTLTKSEFIKDKQWLSSVKSKSTSEN